MKLIERKPKRLFTFGCSFTAYHWLTWAQVVASDLDIPLYNYGRSGGGNHFIANMITQANIVHQFTEDDLVIVCWTNVCREDRWIKNKWVLPGNIFTQGTYPQSWVEEFVDPVGMLLMDLGQIDLCKHLLEGIGCQWHFLSMVDLVDQPDQGNTDSSKNKMLSFLRLKKRNELIKKERFILEIVDRYSNTLDCIKPGFFEILWNNDIHEYKFKYDNEIFDNKFSDGHPFPLEHYKYLKTVFDEHQFNPETLTAVEYAQQRFEIIVREETKDSDKHMAVYQFEDSTSKLLESDTTIAKNNKLNLI